MAYGVAVSTRLQVVSRHNIRLVHSSSWYPPDERQTSQDTMQYHESLHTHCAQPDTLIHRLTDCSEGINIWLWTPVRIATILQTDPKHVLPEWTVCPTFYFWPPQRHGAIQWILSHIVYYRTQLRYQVSLAEYADFMRRARWKVFQAARRRNSPHTLKIPNSTCGVNRATES